MKTTTCALTVIMACLTGTLLAENGFVPLTNLTWRFIGNVTRKGDVLTARVSEDAPRSDSKAVARIDLSDYSFGGFEVRVRARGERIGVAPQSWLGLKVMVEYQELSGGRDKHYPGAPGRTGSFDWTSLSCCDVAPGRLRDHGTLVLGLQQASGCVSFDLGSLEIRPLAPLVKMTNETYRVSYPAHVSNRGRLRGFMLSTRPCEKDFADLHAWGATLVRFQMRRSDWGWSFARQKDRASYETWLGEQLDLLEKTVLPMAVKYGIQVIVDLHAVPGGNRLVFTDAECIETYLAAWRRIASRFRGRANVYGYDLINEPAQGQEGICTFWDLQDRAAREIRRIDPDVTIVVEANDMDSPQAFSYLSPLAMDNVIYQVHVYNPGSYTHQGVGTRRRDGDGVSWAAASKGDGKGYLRHALEPVLTFQRRHGVRIVVGEFSAIAWAPGAAQYLKDSIELFEEYGWDWTYHAFREWDAWSVEHEGNSLSELRPSTDNDRMRIIKSGLMGQLQP